MAEINSCLYSEKVDETRIFVSFVEKVTRQHVTLAANRVSLDLRNGMTLVQPDGSRRVVRFSEADHVHFLEVSSRVPVWVQ